MQEAGNVLPVNATSGWATLVTTDGSPVWPVETDEQMSMLAELARVFNARLQEVRSFTGPTEASFEEVVGLGEEVQEAALLYAHLTRRRARFSSSISDLIQAKSPSVIVTTPEWLNSKLMDALYSSEASGEATGIICAWSPKLLRDQVLIRSAAAALFSAAHHARIDIFPTLEIDKMAIGSREVLGGRADGDDIREALGRGAGVLTISTHADGIDAFMGPGHTICPMDQPPAGANDQRSPRCRTTNSCHRHLGSVEEALNSGALISLDAIAARILIWDVCKGFLVSDGVLDPAWGMTRRLIDSPKVGAILTPWEFVFSGPALISRLSDLLMRGTSVGKGLVRFTKSRLARRHGHQMCLFGDPGVRTKAATRQNELVPTHLSPRLVNISQKVQMGDLKEVAFVRAVIQRTISHVSGELLELAQEALQAIQAFETAVWVGATVEGSEIAPGPVMRKGVIRYFLRRGILVCKDWLQLASIHQQRDRLPCFGCGTHAKAFIARPRIPGVSRRRIMVCPRCGVVEDAPIKSNFKIRVRNETEVCLPVALPEQRCDAGLLLISKLPSDSRGFMWPRENEIPSVRFQIPRPMPAGPIDAALLIMVGGSFAFVSQPVSGLIPVTRS